MFKEHGANNLLSNVEKIDRQPDRLTGKKKDKENDLADVEKC